MAGPAKCTAWSVRNPSELQVGLGCCHCNVDNNLQASGGEGKKALLPKPEWAC